MQTAKATTSPPDRPRLLTAKEAAYHLNISENGLAKHRLQGDGPPFIKFGRRIRYGMDALDNWLAQRTYTSLQ
jgi:hypothetical protein